MQGTRFKVKEPEIMGYQWIAPRPWRQEPTLPTEHKPIYSDLLNCLHKSVCIVGCWKSSLLAKKIPHMHVNSISDSNSNSNLITLRAHAVLTLCYLCWWSFLPPTSAFTLVAHVVLTLCYLHWWSYSASTTAFTLLPHVVVPLLLALCGGGGSGGRLLQYIVTCTVYII